MTIKPITLRRAAALNEMASLGIWSAKAAVLLNVDAVRVCQLAKQFDIRLPPKPKQISELSRAVRDGYAAGLTPHQIALRHGRTANCIRVVACKLGLTREAPRDPGKYKRGYLVPPHLKAEYAALRKIGCSFKEAGYELGLIQRPRVSSHQPIPQPETIQ